MDQTLIDIFKSFQIPGECVSYSALKTGHIHETFISVWNDAGKEVRYVHQKLNGYVFPDLPAVMHNIEKVTEHIQSRLEREDRYCTLDLVSHQEGESYVDHGESGFWRTFAYVENTNSYVACPDAQVAEQAGRVCGRFAYYVSDLPVAELKETIPHFIDSSYRFTQLEDAVSEDASGRLVKCQSDVDFAMQNREMASRLMVGLQDGTLPSRASHNDTKLDNILFCSDTGEGVCIVDLDTCMPGSPLFDYGDLVRTCCILAAEDEPDLSKINVVPELYQAVKKGFLDGCGNILTPEELELLPLMPQIVSLTLGIRFLADHINGDKYFRIHRENHNLDRARAQFQVFRSLRDAM